jgi:carbamoyl-phosphate synthase small subunit
VTLNNKNTAKLILADGTVFQGTAIGKVGTTVGEICFNTGMTGYQEVFTDPSYFGQIMVTTNDHIGNYGVRDEETESNSVKIAGLVCKNFSPHQSRQMASNSLDEYFMENQIVGIADVDTRQIVRHIRSKGAMNAIISSEISDEEVLKSKLNEHPSMEGMELATQVSSVDFYTSGDENAEFRVAVMDYGLKTNIVRCLNERGCFTGIFNANATFDEVMAWKPDGIMLSNGPGDPEPLTHSIETVKRFLDSDTPIFGICLGHQIMCLAMGMKTYKMHNGHRGLNHPVFNLMTKRSEITSQNHGFAVDGASIPDNVIVTHKNLNDDTIEGVQVKDKLAFAVQYHPEASPGPHDSRYLFDNFIENIRKSK